MPYPITEPAIGTGVLAGPVWMRAGPPEASGPSKPQAFGAGALWTDGGSRGVVAFDHRAWGTGRWRTTAIYGRADLRLTYDGLAPGGGQDRGFTLRLRGGSVAARRRLADGPDSLGVRVFASATSLDFADVPPGELLAERSRASVNGLSLSWSRDTRDEVYAPSKGIALDATVTSYAPMLGASFDAQSLAVDWRRYHAAGKGVLGTRIQFEASLGDPPFYLRPYVAFRGIPSLRYAGEQVASFEGEYRLPLGKRWDVLAFGGVGTARADTRGVHGDKTVSAAGIGVRFTARKYFGLTFGIDLAQGPDGQVGYLQIGNAWSR